MKLPDMKGVNHRTKQNADGVGIGGSVILAWLAGIVSTRYGIDIPPEVIAAFAALLGGVAARFKDTD